MRVRVDIKRMMLPERSMSRRQRLALSEEIGRELSRLLQHGAPAGDDPGRRSTPSAATQIAAAIAAQVSASPTRHRMGRHT
jgi:hypothetical protein